MQSNPKEGDVHPGLLPDERDCDRDEREIHSLGQEEGASDGGTAWPNRLPYPVHAGQSSVEVKQNALLDVGAQEWRTIRSRESAEAVVRASDRQVGGGHYKDYAVEPGEYSQKNKLGYMEGNAIKYITRHRDKGGPQDIQKAIHCLELLLEWEYGDEPPF